MSKKLTFYAVAPQKDKKAIIFFFKNLNFILKNKEAVLNNKKLYETPLIGTGVSALYIGEYATSVGELLSLYEKTWKIQTNGETRYLIHMAGSPLSGGNQCTFWCAEKQEFVVGAYDLFSTAFVPLSKLRKTKRTFKRGVRISKKLEGIFKRFDRLYFQFQAEKELKAKQEAEKIRLEEISDPKPDKNGVVAAMRYCQAGDLSSLQIVWKRDKKQFDAQTKNRLTPLNFAAKQWAVLNFLVKIGKAAHFISPVAAACEVKDNVVKRLNLLEKLGADINEKNENGEPPIVVAAESFNVAAVRWLVRHGADVSATNAKNETAREIILKNKDIFQWKNTLRIL